MTIPIPIYLSLLMFMVLIKIIKCKVTPGVLTTSQKQYLLDMHNDIRNTVAIGNYTGNGGVNLPEATNMNQLLWVSIYITSLHILI